MHATHTPHQTVVNLLAQMREAALKGDMHTFEQRSDDLTVFASAYVLPSVEIDWRKEGIKASHIQARILNRLFLKPGTVVDRRTMMNAIYFDRADGGPMDKIIDIFVCKLRKKLKAAGGKYEIRGHWGLGWEGIIHGDSSVNHSATWC